MSKTHYAGVEWGNESDPTNYWDETTGCGIYVSDTVNVNPNWLHVDCKNCLAARERFKKLQQQTNKSE